MGETVLCQFCLRGIPLDEAVGVDVQIEGAEFTISMHADCRDEYRRKRLSRPGFAERHRANVRSGADSDG